VGPVFTLEEARRENPAFFRNHEENATYVAIKLAQTLDGRIAEAPGRRTSITGHEARLETHRLRAGFDGVMVGSETVLVDDPRLTVREGFQARVQPVRVVLDTEARTPAGAALFFDVPQAPVLVFTAQDASEASVRRLEGAGATVHQVPRGSGGVSLESVLTVCWDVGIRSLFCEGGGRVASHLMKNGWAQRLYLFVAPFVLGEEGVPAFTGLDSREDWNAWRRLEPTRQFGDDVLLTFDRAE
jgi:diaminohydroxyphosphoribosylaminopyrimidine deaminase/5-amino-6-(5-phosphoribosylamino)uracil reductase